MLARWDVLLTGDGAEIVKDAMTTIASKSNPYQAYTASGDAIRGAVVEAEHINGIDQFPDFMMMAPESDAPGIEIPQPRQLNL